MGTFNASLRTIGDRRGVAAVVTLAERQISIHVGDEELGSWTLDEVGLEETDNSVYRLEVDGDRVLIDFEDAASFRELLSSASRMRNRVKVRGVKAKAAKAVEVKEKKSPKPERAVKEKKSPKSERAVKEKKPRQPRPAQEVKSETGGFGARVDRVLAAAERRWGPLLPSWLFTRGTPLVLLILLVATIAVPGVVSMVLLVAGLLTVLFGAVVYTDNMLASKVLPGRMTPMHVLLFGVTILMLGVLVGVIA